LLASVSGLGGEAVDDLSEVAHQTFSPHQDRDRALIGIQPAFFRAELAEGWQLEQQLQEALPQGFFATGGAVASSDGASMLLASEARVRTPLWLGHELLLLSRACAEVAQISTIPRATFHGALNLVS